MTTQAGSENRLTWRKRDLSAEQHCKSARVQKYGLLLLGLTPLLLLLSRFLLPQQLVDNRVGVSIINQVYAWGTAFPATFVKSDFPVWFYHAFYAVFPFIPDSLQVWDVAMLAVGGVLLLALLVRFTDIYKSSGFQTVVLLTLVVISGIFIFQVSKDFIQCLIFTLAFAVVISKRLSMRTKTFLLALLFIGEGLLWRTYYLIAAFFIPSIYLMLSRITAVKRTDGSLWKSVIVCLAITVATMVVFAFVLHAVSPSDYSTIAYQHSIDREDFTATDAASGISSVIPISSGSSPLAFVVNWAINVFRLLVPIELLVKSLKYFPFVIFQLVVTWCVVRTLSRLKSNRVTALMVAVMLAFVITSASFEPDFGSWVRHETAAFSFLIELVGLSNLGCKESAS